MQPAGLRQGADIHRQAPAIRGKSAISGKSLNALVAEHLQAAVARIESIKVAKATGKGKR
jgi:hypothetical protein